MNNSPQAARANTAKINGLSSDSYDNLTGSYTLNTADGSVLGHTRSRSDSWNTTKPC